MESKREKEKKKTHTENMFQLNVCVCYFSWILRQITINDNVCTFYFKVYLFIRTYDKMNFFIVNYQFRLKFSIKINICITHNKLQCNFYSLIFSKLFSLIWSRHMKTIHAFFLSILKKMNSFFFIWMRLYVWNFLINDDNNN